MQLQHKINKYSVETLRENMQLLKWLAEQIKMPTPQKQLDEFIESKHVTTEHEVEHWIRYYNQHETTKGF